MGGVTELRRAVEKAKKLCGEGIENVVRARRGESLEVPDEDLLARASELLSALANPVRLGILALLAQHDLPVCMLASVLGVEPSLVSHSLRVLKNRGLVASYSIGRYRVYTLARRELVEELLRLLRSHLTKSGGR